MILDVKIGVRFSQNKESRIYNFVRCKFSWRIWFRVQLILLEKSGRVIFWISQRLEITITGIKMLLINERYKRQALHIGRSCLSHRIWRETATLSIHGLLAYQLKKCKLAFLSRCQPPSTWIVGPVIRICYIFARILGLSSILCNEGILNDMINLMFITWSWLS